MQNLFRLGTVAAIACIVLSTVPGAEAAYYHIELRDLEPGQPMTPPVAVVHDNGYRLFDMGVSATPGLEMLAEDGMTDALLQEAMDSASVKQALVGGAAPTFASYKFMIEAEPGDLFSIASMFAKTNDTFVGVSAVALPADEPLTIETNAYDAGTEVNTGSTAHIPAYGNPGMGEEESAPVSMQQSFSIVDDPDMGRVDFTWPPAARLIVTPMPNAVEYTIHISGQSADQPLTPPLVVIHDSRVEVFSVGMMARAGLEPLAEGGDTGPLHDELFPLEGTWSVHVAGDAPGFEHEVSFIAEPGQLVSVASMFARTNDVFIGAAGWALPAAGETVMLDAPAYDAGTEMNSGMMADVPLYGGAGSPVENGVVMEIGQYSIVDDPAGRLDFTWPPAAEITIGSEGPSAVEEWRQY